ncbi:succinyl-diaminopimelate desuccinylase [Anaerovirgula multivorans]|uniref:Succinyl-diaminopimelate desuccinylase n=1 Tax=Anaerovirgula multivorans TaxID=312168 RepID=A0A239B5W4_9FIRM|nr:dipeptidase PepV [Anaerovirgula multivorans]SNS03305.1 succinyl-diaminopimelate desuccinylase [Anaerovirgula multivorans]
MLDKKILDMKDEILEAVRQSIMIRSVESEKKEGAPFGEGVQKALEHALKLADDMGFRTVSLDNMIGYAEYGSGEEMIAVLGHLDVVPEGDGWTYPPFAAEIHENRIYGRGILDDKGPTIGALFALKAIKVMGIPLSKRVRIIFGTNEERGSKGIKYYVERDEMPVAGFTPDAQYPIINAEKGIFTCTLIKPLSKQGKLRLTRISGGTAPNVVPSYAEASIETGQEQKNKIKEILKNIDFIEFQDNESLILKSHGISAHGSTPELGRNAITQLVEFLNMLDFAGDVKQLFEFITTYIDKETDGKNLGINLKDEVSGKLTLNIGTIQGDHTKVSLELNIRYPVTTTIDDFINKLEWYTRKFGIQISNIRHKKPLYVEPNTDLIKKLQKVYFEKTGDEPELIAIGGGTYAKSMDNIVAFGPLFKGELDLTHQPDEYMTIDSLIKNIQIIAAAIHELAK